MKTNSLHKSKEKRSLAGNHPRKWEECLNLTVCFDNFGEAMKTIPVEVRDGVLRLSGNAQLPENAQLAVIALEEHETFSGMPATPEAGSFFAFLNEEPELYSDNDVIPGRRNPSFKGNS